MDVAKYKIWPEAESCVDRLIEVIEAQGVKSVGPGTKGYVWVVIVESETKRLQVPAELGTVVGRRSTADLGL